MSDLIQTILITGAAGYVGGELIKKIKDNPNYKIIGTDIVKNPPQFENSPVLYEQADIRDPKRINEIFNKHKVNTVIHLAAALPSKKGDRREFEYDVNVNGTKVILEACVANRCTKIVISSSGAAYGYHADNASIITEEHPLRGNKAFPYSEQKTQVELMLNEYREKHPELKQIIFRLSATIGQNVSNQISDFFDKPVLIGIKGYKSPFVFVWDQDVVNCLIKSIDSVDYGAYNLSADGVLDIKSIAKKLNKPLIKVPEKVFYNTLKFLRKFNLTQYDPEQTCFLMHRPVLSNQKLKEKFNYIPLKTSEEVFNFLIKQ